MIERTWLAVALLLDGSWQVAGLFCNKAVICADLGEPQARRVKDFYSGKQRKNADECSAGLCSSFIKNIITFKI